MEVAGRRFPVPAPDEREVLVQWLDWQRATVVAKCADLEPGLGSVAWVPTSPGLTIAGVVSHLTDVERHWMVRSFLGELVPAAPGGGWSPPPGRPLELLLQDYREQCARSVEIAAAFPLDSPERWAPDGLPVVTLRWILGHLLQETARHVGHLDLLREHADGRRGY
ncbi:mycothiol transferase [Desertihabitans aurantiacus]|uniref:mycothiol transferase n=1 Tax=Desertihabitans aurantiacus TaxID=2282477 RepID=UPI000DF75AC8|nr:DUF664 domain-containing protein [Desertihabitans aurantiacus]